MKVHEALTGLSHRVGRLVRSVRRPSHVPNRAAPGLDYDETTDQGRRSPTTDHGTNTPPPPRRPWTPGT